MKKIKFLTMALFGGMLGWTSCSNESGNSGGTSSIPETVYQAFDAKYPNARQVSWKTKGAYAVATFYWDPANADAVSNTSKSSAWFTLTGAEWGMSAYEIPFSLLPDTVQKAFLASPYAAWEYDREADVLCRPNADTLYVIEAEQQVGTTETSVDLYYTANAILVKEIIDADIDEDYSGMLPQKPASSVTDWIFERYPDARLIDVELEDGGTEVEFVANGNKMESFFTAASAWVYTKTDFSRKDFTKVPPIVLAALKRSEHYVSLEYVDDLSYYETAASGNYYCFELETRYDDVDVYITEAGEIVDRPNPGTDEDQVSVAEAIQKVIDERYPKAVVWEKEYDDGYLEVTVQHDGIRKELYFNGQNEWIRTTWDIAYNQVPGDVIGFMSSAYAGYQIDREDIEVVDTPAALWYEFEVERNDRELKVQVYADGTLKGERAD